LDYEIEVFGLGWRLMGIAEEVCKLLEVLEGGFDWSRTRYRSFDFLMSRLLSSKTVVDLSCSLNCLVDSSTIFRCLKR
jgi:hypothetical protein